jgi:membrane-bound metal-dependent hydrolase YbcI (DUF457 family)
MFLATHFAVPVLAVIGYEYISGSVPGSPYLKTSSLLTFGLVGLIPDAFYPHLGGGSHLQSVSHSIWALAFFMLMITLVHRTLSPSRDFKFLVFLWLSLLSHYVLDFFSSGIRWLYPLSEAAIGFRFIPQGAWVLSDFLLMGVVFLLVYLIKRGAVGQVRRGSVKSSL